MQLYDRTYSTSTLGYNLCQKIHARTCSKSHIYTWLQISGTVRFWLKVSEPSSTSFVYLRGCADISGGFRG